MRSIMMAGIIKGPFLVLLFLIGTNWRRECEAAATVIAVPIADSKSVSNEGNNMANNPISISPENKTTTLVLPVTHASVTPLETKNKVIEDTVFIEEDNISIAQRDVNVEPPSPAHPCPIENHSGRMEETKDKQKEGESNLGNGNDNTNSSATATTVKEEKVETAFEKISESISGVISTIKNSVVSIFSPGTGIPGSGRMDCYNETINNSSNAGGEGKNMSVNSNDPQKLEDEKAGLLIHPVSSNDTNNNTNETNTSIATDTDNTTTVSTPIQGENSTEPSSKL